MSLKIRKELLIFLILSSFLSLLVGFRGNTNDTITYYMIFKNIGSYDLTNFSLFYNETGVEIGWGLYSKIISLFSDSPVVLFTIFSFFTFFTFYRISRLVEIKFLYVMLYYLPTGFFMMQQFMQIRQGFAIPLVIYGSVLYLSGKKYISLVFFILAVLFHQSSLAFILIFISYLFFNNFLKINTSVFKFFIINILILVFGFIVARFILLDAAMDYFQRLEAYSTTDYAESVGFFSLSNIKFYIEFFLIFLLLNNRLLLNKFIVFFVFIFTVGLSLRVAFYDFGILSGRLSNTFLLIEVFLMPMLLSSRLNKIYLYIYFLLYFLVIFYVTWTFQASEIIKNNYFLPLS
ncbi:EpsG family protein [Acinetobacter baumannii]|uniref:EpsG family protein n=1 Tax=Acinetobacter baumannii TaxID=470 RepID=UPI00273CD71E|nr:EpsG family protein [Acinetobacter baumannii]EKT8009030.1 EpsG family protein [Acinetobacter baumannii]EKU1139372.1 EpsG family protein [Acinetobacter baumannii]EKU4162619.1 EpsG family protein [Acinetobacter baumannii]WLQ02529.1 EpsG family protein [Acinetobacter baumannii]